MTAQWKPDRLSFNSSRFSIGIFLYKADINKSISFSMFNCNDSPLGNKDTITDLLSLGLAVFSTIPFFNNIRIIILLII